MGQSRRVLFINHTGEIGGAERCLLLLLRGLDRSVYEPHVVCFGSGPLVETLQRMDIPCRVIPLGGVEHLSRSGRSTAGGYGHALASAARMGCTLIRHLMEIHPDVVHTNGVKAHLLGGVCARLLGRRVLWHMHDNILSGHGGGLFAAAADRIPHQIMAVSASTAAQFVGRPAAKRTSVVHNAVDLDWFRPDRPADAMRATLGFGPDTLVLAMVAHFARWKGHLVFLDVLDRLGKQGLPVSGLIVGSSIYRTSVEREYEAEVRARVAHLGLQDRVVFTGYQERVANFVNAADLLLHPPVRPEPFGLAPIEAMALGKPVIGSAAGGLLETVDDGRTGFLVQPGDVQGFADAARLLLENPELREEMGRSGRERVHRLFAPRTHQSQVDRIYRELISTRKAGAAELLQSPASGLGPADDPRIP